MPDFNMAGFVLTLIQGTFLLTLMLAVFIATQHAGKLVTACSGMVAVLATGGLVWTTVVMG